MRACCASSSRRSRSTRTSGSELGLRLDPRQESSFEFIELWVNRETYQLRESVLVDLFKNRTIIRFASIEENVGVDDSSFDISVPEGTEIIDLR